MAGGVGPEATWQQLGLSFAWAVPSLRSAWSTRDTYLTSDAAGQRSGELQSPPEVVDEEAAAHSWGFRNSPRLENKHGACGMRSPLSQKCRGECVQRLAGAIRSSNEP